MTNHLAGTGSGKSSFGLCMELSNTPHAVINKYDIYSVYFRKIDLLLYVVFSNAVRRTLSGEVVFNNWNALFKIYEERSSLILVEVSS